MTNKEIFEIVDKIHGKINNINVMVIRHDEKLKSIWKIPVISGATVSIITGIAIFVIRLTS